MELVVLEQIVVWNLLIREQVVFGGKVDVWGLVDVREQDVVLERVIHKGTSCYLGKS